jgi:hypothetical protein
MAVLPARDPAAYAAAYTHQLRWPVAPGHRHRPRSGCTCTDTSCPTPGAHPATSWVVPIRPDELAEQFGQAPGVSVIAPTIAFDAVVLPRAVGMAVMVRLDRRGPVPCLIAAGTATLFVQAGTGSTLDAYPGQPVEVRSGPDGWVALPPSHGVRWDTPPWDEVTGARLRLPHGHAIKPAVTEALRTAVGAGQ